MSLFSFNGQKMMNAAVNTDPLPVLDQDDKPTHFSLKERNILHIKIGEANELKQWYDLGEKLGEGGFGVVLEITEKSTLKKWAMKTVIKTIPGDRLKLIRREIQILKLIQHPHIIYLDKVFETPKKIFLILEKCNGELAKLYHQQKPFNEKISRKIMKDLTGAVAYLHKHDIVHRDLKMENILFGENPNDPTDEYYIKLTDFGLSIVKYGQGIDSMLHDFCGTLLYMAPEMITTRSYSQQCDCWSVGVILYMMVEGNFPFYSKNEKELQKQICTKDLTFVNSKLSPEVKDLISGLLQKDPANRITAAEVLHHPWTTSKRMSEGMSQNILQMMKEWKSEMTVPVGGQESDWVTTKNVPPPAKKDNVVLNLKQPLNLPKTNIRFDRNKTHSPSRNKTSKDYGATTKALDNNKLNNLRK